MVKIELDRGVDFEHNVRALSATCAGLVKVFSPTQSINTRLRAFVTVIRATSINYPHV